MNELTLHKQKARLTRELTAWQAGAIGLLAASAVVNAVFASAVLDCRQQLAEQAEQLEQAQYARDYALEKLGAVVLQVEADRQAWAEQAAAYEAVGAYRYVGECAITAYCPCAACCGQLADGLTATGLPAGPGIVAVDPEVIPLGSTVVIDGQRYLAADTGVTGLHVDICAADHAAATAAGARTADVWVITNDRLD